MEKLSMEEHLFIRNVVKEFFLVKEEGVSIDVVSNESKIMLRKCDDLYRKYTELFDDVSIKMTCGEGYGEKEIFGSLTVTCMEALGKEATNWGRIISVFVAYGEVVKRARVVKGLSLSDRAVEELSSVLIGSPTPLNKEAWGTFVFRFGIDAESFSSEGNSWGAIGRWGCDNIIAPLAAIVGAATST